MKVYNFPQYSKEWWDIRRLKLTASHAQAIAANGKGLQTYVRSLVRDELSSADKEHYSNKSMERGLELEPSAAMAYEFETGITTQEVGFVVLNRSVGCSPDRLAGQNGLVEIKCPEDKVYFDYLLDRKIDTKYEWQMHMQMYICYRQWCDYVVYNPNFKKDLIIKRVYWDKKKIMKLLRGFGSGIRMIRKIQKGMRL